MKKIVMSAAMFLAAVCFGSVANAQNTVQKKEAKKECCQKKADGAKACNKEGKKCCKAKSGDKAAKKACCQKKAAEAKK